MYKNIISVFSTNISSILISLINSILLSRFLGVENRGSFVLLSASVLLISYLVSFGFNTGITYYSSKSKSLGKELLTSSILFSLIISIVVSLIIVLILGDKTFYTFFPKGVNTFLILISLFVGVFLSSVNSNLSSYCASIDKFKKINQSKIYAQVILLLTLITLQLIFGNNTVINKNLIVIIFCIPIFAQTIPFIPLIFSLNYSLKHFKIKPFQSLFKWGIVPYFASLFQFLNYKLDFWFIDYYSGEAALGEYSLSSSLAQLLWVVPASIGTVLFPTVVKLVKSEKRKQTNRLALLTLSIAIIGGTFVYFFSDFIIPLVYGAEYSLSSNYLKILIIGSVPYTTSMIIASYFLGVNKPKLNLWSSFIGFLITLVLNVIFIPKFGVIGAAWTTSTSYIITTAIVVFLYLRQNENN
jgi:O-antigen/teichoic acid export membrane protein